MIKEDEALTNQDVKKPRPVRCKLCGRKYVTKQALVEHIGKEHQANIPKDWSPARYECYLRTGKTTGYCIYCKKEVGFNEKTGKYNRMCGSAECKKKARDLAQKNYIGLHGKPYSIDDPEIQRKMVYSKKHSGTYTFVDDVTGKKYTAMYDSSYGKDFYQMLDLFLGWDGSDVSGPSPHTYYYMYEGKRHFYVPDAYIHSLNLEVELKDGGDDPNTHPKIMAIDKVKEAKKDEVMLSLKDQVNYIKICNKDYTEFFALLAYLKDKDVCELPKWESMLESPVYKHSVAESTEVMEKRDLITVEKDKIIAQTRLSDPEKLTYEKLLLSYRNRLFHEKLTRAEWDDLYSELHSMELYMKKMLNARGEESSRMEYETRKALMEIQQMMNYMDDVGYRHCMESAVTETKSVKHDYFYHLAPKTANVSKGITSLEYQYTHDKQLFRKNAEKYRERLCTGWNIYPNKTPESLTDEEIIDGLKKFRRSAHGANMVYFFKYPPYTQLGPKMKDVLKDKKLYQIDLNNPALQNIIEEIDYGYESSSNDNALLNKEFYDNVTPNEYYKNYTEDGTGPLFAPLNHIAVSPKGGVIPRQYIERVNIPDSMVDVPIAESAVFTKDDIYINFEDWESKKKNVLLVTGLSGSGKTTTGYELAYDYDAELFQLDWISHPEYMQDSPETPNYGLWQYVKAQCPNALANVTKAKKEAKTSDNTWHRIVLTVFDTILEFAYKHPSKRFIVEGIQIPGHLHDYEGIEEFPIIIKGTSVIKSMIRRFRRDNVNDFFKTGGDNILKYYANSENYMNMFREQLTEATFIEAFKDEVRCYPIFVFLSYTHSRMATIIKKVSGDPYAHASTSFDTSLEHMISFNSNGMVVEDIHKDIYNTNKDIIRYSLYIYVATNKEYQSMRQFVDELLGRQSKMRYNLLGLTNFIFGRGSQREDAFFCSEFVSAAIAAGNSKIFDRPPYMIKPYYFAKNKHFIFIKTGLLKNYDQKQIDKIVDKKLEEGGYHDVKFDYADHR